MTRLPMVAIIVLAFAAACGGDEDRELVIMTHDSFDISESVIREFEEANDATVVIQKAGDAGEALVRAILEKGNPSADLLYGIDNTFLGRALEEEIFDVYRPKGLDQVPAEFRLDDTGHVTPIDYGYVNDTSSADGEEQDIFIGTDENSLVGAIFTVDHRKGDRECKFIYNCSREEIYLINGFINFAPDLMNGRLLLRRAMKAI